MGCGVHSIIDQRFVTHEQQITCQQSMIVSSLSGKERFLNFQRLLQLSSGSIAESVLSLWPIAIPLHCINRVYCLHFL